MIIYTIYKENKRFWAIFFIISIITLDKLYYFVDVIKNKNYIIFSILFL